MVLTLLGAGSGILVTFLTAAILREVNPGLTILITGRWVAAAIVLAVIGSTLGVAYPAMRAASYDPVVALAYE
jgi:putative ABC transport system permease protein